MDSATKRNFDQPKGNKPLANITLESIRKAFPGILRRMIRTVFGQLQQIDSSLSPKCHLVIVMKLDR